MISPGSELLGGGAIGNGNQMGNARIGTGKEKSQINIQQQFI